MVAKFNLALKGARTSSVWNTYLLLGVLEEPEIPLCSPLHLKRIRLCILDRVFRSRGGRIDEYVSFTP